MASAPMFSKDNRPGLSVEDRIFADMMNWPVKKESGNWTAPLPLRSQVTQLPDTYSEVLKQLKAKRKSLDRKSEMKDHYFSLMQKILDNSHAERVPENKVHTSKWYLPHFGTYHPQKPSKICIVFDSAAKVEEVLLSKLLLSGPDLATFCLRKTAREAEAQFGCDSREFIEKDFHVDDGLKSLPGPRGVHRPVQTNSINARNGEPTQDRLK